MRYTFCMKPGSLPRILFYCAVSLIAVSILIVALAWIFSTPANNRAWLPEQAELASADITEDSITLHNVRDWTYDGPTIVSKEWRNITVRPAEIVRAWFILEPFADLDAIGHTFLSFEFSDGTALAFSVEARREATETYSALRGLLPTYELAYQWGTERDFITRRINYLAHPVRMYPLELPEGGAAALFTSLVEETNDLYAEPRFYHTLLANCTNALAHIVNGHYPGTLPFDTSWMLTGLSDTYLMKEGFIRLRGTNEETKAAYDLTSARETIQEHASASASEFSAYLRTLIAR